MLRSAEDRFWHPEESSDGFHGRTKKGVGPEMERLVGGIERAEQSTPASRSRPRTQVHHRGLELEGGCYAGARMARRWSRAKVISEMSAKAATLTQSATPGRGRSEGSTTMCFLVGCATNGQQRLLTIPEIFEYIEPTLNGSLSLVGDFFVHNECDQSQRLDIMHGGNAQLRGTSVEWLKSTQEPVATARLVYGAFFESFRVTYNGGAAAVRVSSEEDGLEYTVRDDGSQFESIGPKTSNDVPPICILRSSVLEPGERRLFRVRGQLPAQHHNSYSAFGDGRFYLYRDEMLIAKIQGVLDTYSAKCGEGADRFGQLFEQICRARITPKRYHFVATSADSADRPLAFPLDPDLDIGFKSRLHHDRYVSWFWASHGKTPVLTAEAPTPSLLLVAD